MQVFALTTSKLGRLMSTLTLTCRDVWLTQSPLSEPGQRALRTLPVVLRELFGPAAQQALEQGIQVNQMWQQFASFQGPDSDHHRVMALSSG